MADCLNLPDLPLPPLPLPFSIPVIDIPSVGLDANFCCKLPPLRTPPIVVALTVDITSNPTFAAAVLAVQAAVATVTAYIDQLPLSCPLE